MPIFKCLDPIHLKKKSIVIYIYTQAHTSVFIVKRFEELYHFGPLKLFDRLIIHNEKKHVVQLYRALQEIKNMEKALRKNEEGAGLYGIRR